MWPVEKRFPKLEEDISTDIAIVGGGIAGISSAYYLQEAGYNAVVIEQDEIGSGASGASSGMLYYGSGTEFLEAIELYGYEKAKLLWNETRETMQAIDMLVEKNNIECGYRKPGGIMAAKTDEHKSQIKKEYAAVKKLGIDAEIFDSSEIKSHFAGKEFLAGLHFPECSQIQPALFAASLASTVNLQVFEHTPYMSFKELNSKIRIETPHAAINAERLLFATNLHPLFGLEKFFQTESSVIIASKRLSREEMKSIWLKEKFIWSMESDYDIVYPADSRLILELYRLKNMKEKIVYYYPNKFVVDTQWGDSWSKTQDWLPIIDNVKENISVAVAMGDQGVVMGFTAGRKITKLLEGKEDEFLALMSPQRFAGNS